MSRFTGDEMGQKPPSWLEQRYWPRSSSPQLLLSTINDIF